MKLTPPKAVVFWISVFLAVLGVVGSLVTIPFVSALASFFIVVGFVLLALGNLIKGL